MTVIANNYQLVGLTRCPHCGVAHPHLPLRAATEEAVKGASPNTVPRRWAVYCCATCGGGVLVSTNGAIHDIIPAVPEVHKDIPEPARRFLQQAMETLHAPDAAAVMAGSAVDAMLKELGLTDGSLYSRIDQAVADHKITKAMGDWAHEVRLGSNRPRHADKEEPHVTPEQAKQSVEFAEALGYFLFVLSARIQRGTDAAKKASAS
jgi:hypothetical protein